MHGDPLGYIVTDPTTGAGAYLIDGGFNGGTDGAGCDGTPSTAPAAQPVSKPSINLFAMLALVILVVIAAPIIIEAGVTAALTGTLLVASTTAAAAPGPNIQVSQAIQEVWDQTFGRAYGKFPTGPDYPGDDVQRCPDAQKDALEAEKKEACAKPSSCNGNDCDPNVIQQKMANSNACIAKRLEVMFVCFGGGDYAHWEQVRQRLGGLVKCQDCLTKSLAKQCPKNP